jgi:hypothetical protein
MANFLSATALWDRPGDEPMRFQATAAWLPRWWAIVLVLLSVFFILNYSRGMSMEQRTSARFAREIAEARADRRPYFRRSGTLLLGVNGRGTRRRGMVRRNSSRCWLNPRHLHSGPGRSNLRRVRTAARSATSGSRGASSYLQAIVERST